jgi:putative flippase GtrA
MISRYVINGLFATFVHYIVLYINIELLDMRIVGLANFIGAIFGITFSFFGNKYFVFKDQKTKLANQFLIFCLLYLLIAVFHGAALFFWTDMYGFDYRLGFIIASFIQFALSYFGNKLLVFKV